MSSNFGGKVALVTGGGGGIGRALCQVLVRDGAKVVAADRNFQTAQETVSLLPNPGDHLAVSMDVTSNESIDSAIKAITEKYQTPPSLVANCAGVLEMAPSWELDEKTFANASDVNFKGTFFVSQAVIKLLLKQQAPGAVVNIASIAGGYGLRDLSHYSGSKGAVMSLTKAMAGELAKKGIRVNCVLPGLIDTPLVRDTPLADSIIPFTALGRKGQPGEVAEVLAFLLSEKSSYMVGSCVEVTGGYTM
nr:estradiol 17-beta-dehydrogenase 8-like [Cherax quadricarinatus]